MKRRSAKRALREWGSVEGQASGTATSVRSVGNPSAAVRRGCAVSVEKEHFLESVGRSGLRAGSGRAGAVVLAAVAMFSGVAMGVDARKTELSVAGDTRAAFLVEPFCFLPGGSLDFSVSNFKLTGEKAGARRQAGFLVRKVDGASYSSANVADMAGDGCLLKKTQPSDTVPPRCVGAQGLTCTGPGCSEEVLAGLTLKYGGCRAQHGESQSEIELSQIETIGRERERKRLV